MSATTKLFAQVEEALGDPRVLDRELIRDLLEMARLLERALSDCCRANLELKAMDANVIGSANNLRDAIEAFSKSYTNTVIIEDADVERAIDEQIEAVKGASIS